MQYMEFLKTVQVLKMVYPGSTIFREFFERNIHAYGNLLDIDRELGKIDVNQ